MEICIKSVSYSAKHYDLNQEIARILHNTPYTNLSPNLINFFLNLQKDRRFQHRPHNGMAFLSVPTEQIGALLLREYGIGPTASKRLVLYGRQLVFELSHRQVPRPDILDQIRRTPYVDPSALREAEERAEFFDSHNISINIIQFGWECRDSVFSVEWEDTTLSSLSFSEDRREIRIAISRPPSTFHIALRFAQLKRVSIHRYQEQPTLFFTLYQPPIFEQSDMFAAILHNQRDMPPRTRLSSLPWSNHERVVAHSSLALRLVCSSGEGLSTFNRLSQSAQLRHVDENPYPVEYRRFFSEAVMTAVEQHLRTLNWCVAFQVKALLCSLSIDAYEALAIIPKIREMVTTKKKRYTAAFLRSISPRLKFFSAGHQTLEDHFDAALEQFVEPKAILEDDDDLFDALHVTITPTSMVLDGPFPERSNRVIRSYPRRYHESFLRVSFLEEDQLHFRFNDREVDQPSFLNIRVGDLLKEGLTIAGRKFEFLAYSQSALKEHSVWFVKPFLFNGQTVNAQTIIHGLGRFTGLDWDLDLPRCPARYAARISQAFTATSASITVKAEEVHRGLDDIKLGKHCFTDGVGTISPDLAREIWMTLKTGHRKRQHRAPPRAFQVRLMGSKGMLSVNYKLSGRMICLRPSMIKFEASQSLEVEIARAFDRPAPYFLNRPLIMLLDGLGIKYEAFKDFQDLAVAQAREAVASLSYATSMFEQHGLGASFRLPSVLRHLEKLGISNHDGTFYRLVLEYAIHHVLRELKNHARIPIPGGWTLVGVADEHRYLDANQIYACVKPTQGGTIYLEGPVLISRSPTIHPGDVQIAHAIGEPPHDSPFAVEPLHNTVVFSVKGDRPLPSKLGGGDLDGDEYNLLPLKDLPQFSPTTVRQPGEYEPAERKVLDRNATMSDVADFVVDYIKSDVLGLVATNWLIIADQSSENIFDEDCLRLAQLHSDAVDYPKSGQAVALEKIPKLHSKVRPDWNAPETKNPDKGKYYESKRVIGRLFRAITLPAIEKTRRRYDRELRRVPHESDEEEENEISDISELLAFSLNENLIDTLVEGVVSRYLEDDTTATDDGPALSKIFEYYRQELEVICSDKDLSYRRPRMLSEAEAMVGTIAQRTSQPRRRKDLTARLREQTDHLVRSIRDQFQGPEDDYSSLFPALKRAWTAWKMAKVKRQHRIFGAESFSWIALGSIFDAVREIEEAEREMTRRYH